MATAEVRVRGFIKKTFHGRKFSERLKKGETLPCDCGFIQADDGVERFVNIADMEHRDREKFVVGTQVEFTSVVANAEGQRDRAVRVAVLG
ncbi:MAG TPA: hypothetical protein VGN16_15130 [Acidobacteriaceae bacterium]